MMIQKYSRDYTFV